MPSFACSCYVAPRHLPSFPTRRSSDLGGDQEVISSVPQLFGLWPSAFGLRPLALRLSHVASPVSASPTTRGPDPASTADRRSRAKVRDRKSTRLNSSHLGISYAVFCLFMLRRPPTSTVVPYTTLFRSRRRSGSDLECAPALRPLAFGLWPSAFGLAP